MNQTTENTMSVYESEYIPFIHKFGRFTNLLGAVLAFLPLLVLAFVYNLRPSASAIIAGAVMQLSITGIFCFLEPITYAPILGPAGTYMSFLSGNVTNLRVPAAAAAMTAADVTPGSEKGSVIATVGMAVSIIVNVLFLTVGVVLGSSILSALPASVVAALNNILPALFGALLAQQFVNNPKIGSVAIVLTGIMFALYKGGLLAFLPGNPVYAVVLTAVFGTILIGRKMASKKMAKDA